MKIRSFRPLVATMAFAVAGVAALPASAADFVQDGAGMFSASAVAQLNERLSAFNAQTGKEIVVVTTPSLSGATLQSAADSTFSQQSVNGVLIYIAKDDRRDMIVPDRAGVQAGWFGQDTLANIRTAMEDQFKAENYDAGITGAVNSLLQIYRDHLGSLQQSRSGYAVAQNGRASQGVHLSMFWWIIILVVGFLILRSIMRAATMARYSNMPPPGGAPPPGGYGPGYGPGYGGYGPGYGYGGFGGGGGFWSGLLGGLGGAWLGNELFRGGGGIGGMGGGGAMAGGVGPQDGGNAPDAGGWQSDAGQAGLGSGGDWSGGGFGSDFGGGGGGGDFGGGGGDSGGGW